MYKPQNIILSSSNTSKNLRLLLVGPPKWGKTYSVVTTFPNPLVVDFDNGLTAINGIDVAPFYDGEWFKKTFPGISMRTNALSKFIVQHASQMTGEQTLVLDSLSTICDYLNKDLTSIQPKGKNGEPDGYWFWAQWGNWLRDFCVLLTSLKCNVVLIAHEAEVRDAETGRLTGYRWLLKGQDFSPRLSQFFTDVFRQVKETKESQGKITEEYKWQVKQTPLFPYANTRMNCDTLYIPASYNEIIKRYGQNT